MHLAGGKLRVVSSCLNIALVAEDSIASRKSPTNRNLQSLNMSHCLVNIYKSFIIIDNQNIYEYIYITIHEQLLESRAKENTKQTATKTEMATWDRVKQHEISCDIRYHQIKSCDILWPNTRLTHEHWNIPRIPMVIPQTSPGETCTELGDFSFLREVSIHHSGHSMGFEEFFPWDAAWEFRTNDASHGAQQLICVTCKVHCDDLWRSWGIVRKQLKEFAKCCLGYIPLVYWVYWVL